MNPPLKNGLRRAVIGSGRQSAMQLRKQRAMLRRGVISKDDLDSVLRDAEASVSLLAQELEAAIGTEAKTLTPHDGTVLIGGIVCRPISEVYHG